MSDPYESLVARATEESLPAEDWQVNLDLCDRVSNSGDPNAAAHQAFTAVTARLQHAHPKVQLFSLTLADMLGKNVNAAVVYPQLTNPALVAQLDRLAHDPGVSEQVRVRLVGLVKEWNQDLGSAGHSGTQIQLLYEQLQRENLTVAADPDPTEEDEELKRVLALSLQEQGGRNQWSSSTYPENPSAATASSSSQPATYGQSQQAPSGSTNTNPFLSHTGGAAPTSGPSSAPSQAPPEQSLIDISESETSPVQSGGVGGTSATAAAAAALGTATPLLTASQSQQTATGTPTSQQSTAPGAGTLAGADAGVGSTQRPGDRPVVSSRVRALYDFNSSEPGELSFQVGDIIRVLATLYAHWWKGELRGQVGIFPVNHVEILPNPTADDLANDAQLEADILASSTAIDRLVDQLAATFDDPQEQRGQLTSGSVADRQRLEGLYNDALAVAPKINELIDRYTAKLAELRGLNEKFAQARSRYIQVTSSDPQVGGTTTGGATAAGGEPFSSRRTASGSSTWSASGSANQHGPGVQGVPESFDQAAAAAAAAGAQTQNLPPQQEPAPAYDASPSPHQQHQHQPQPQPQPQSSIPQPPPGMDVTSPEYATWYYANFPQNAPTTQ